MYLKISNKCLILCFFVFSSFADVHSKEDHEKTLSRQKRLLFFPQYTVWQLSMAIISKVSYIDSHRVAINSGFQINYALPYDLTNIVTPTYFNNEAVRSYSNATSPVVQFFKKLLESEDVFGSEKNSSKIAADHPKINDNVELNSKNNAENNKDENLETLETTTTETETTPKEKKKKRIRKDVTAAELYDGIKDTLKISGYHEDCLLKSICELARHPLEDHDHDLVYEVLEFILTPSIHQGFDPEHEGKEQKFYVEAEIIGKSDGDCDSFYAFCEKSPLSSITGLMNYEVFD